MITPAQFVNLIEPSDPYVMIGPAIVAKGSVSQFMLEWKTRSLNVSQDIRDSISSMTAEDVVSSFGRLQKVYPEITPIVNEYDKTIKDASCEKCVQSRFVSAVVSLIRNLGVRESEKDYVNLLLERFGGVFARKANVYDVEWISSESLRGVGCDLIPKLTNCLECVIKHLGRAKILYNEAMNGYPEHSDIAIDELTAGNKDLEEWWCKFMDCCAEMDMASNEAVGDVVSLDKSIAVKVLYLANKIRQQRLLFQEDSTKVPDFDALRIDVKKLEISINKEKS